MDSDRLPVRPRERVPPSERRDTLGSRRADDDIDDSHGEVHLDEAAVELRELRGRAEKVRERKDVDERGILKQDDGLAQNDRTGDAEHLWQDDVPVGIEARQSEGLACLELTPVHRAQSNPNDLRIIGRLEQAKGDESRVSGADRNGTTVAAQMSQHDRHQEEEPEQHEDERDRPDQGDVAADDLVENAYLKMLHEGETGSQDHSDQKSRSRQRE